MEENDTVRRLMPTPADIAFAESIGWVRTETQYVKSSDFEKGKTYENQHGDLAVGIEPIRYGDTYIVGVICASDACQGDWVTRDDDGKWTEA